MKRIAQKETEALEPPETHIAVDTILHHCGFELIAGFSAFAQAAVEVRLVDTDRRTVFF